MINIDLASVSLYKFGAAHWIGRFAPTKEDPNVWRWEYVSQVAFSSCVRSLEKKIPPPSMARCENFDMSKWLELCGAFELNGDWFEIPGLMCGRETQIPVPLEFRWDKYFWDAVQALGSPFIESKAAP